MHICSLQNAYKGVIAWDDFSVRTMIPQMAQLKPMFLPACSYALSPIQQFFLDPYCLAEEIARSGNARSASNPALCVSAGVRMMGAIFQVRFCSTESMRYIYFTLCRTLVIYKIRHAKIVCGSLPKKVIQTQYNFCTHNFSMIYYGVQLRKTVQTTSHQLRMLRK
jgi:hypothetical protein